MKIQNTFQVGDLVTTYNKGVHEVTATNSTTLWYEKVLNENGTTSGPRKGTCHFSYCKLVNHVRVLKDYKDDVTKAEFKKTALLTLLTKNITANLKEI
jgi:hypothetical protein